MTSRAPLVAAAVALVLIATSACGPGVDLSKALEVTDILSGYYDNGLKEGKNHLLPSITFRLKNRGDKSIGPTQLNVAFWHEGDDGEKDSILVPRIKHGNVAPGETTDPITVRSTVGYTLEGARADFFTHSLFRDFTVKVFAMRSGEIYKLGEFKVDRVIIPHAAGQ